jgi:hypothetical protein
LIIEGGAIGTVLTSLGGPVTWSNSITVVNANVSNLANIANLKITATANLGSNSNVKISGGNVGEVLKTNGWGELYWEKNLPNEAFQPAIEFTAIASGINQTFTSANIANFDDNTFASVYVNGVLMRNSQYEITGSILTVYDYLQIGDEITVGSTLTGGIAEGTVRSISTATVDPSSLGFSLNTPGNVPLTTIGTITLNVPPASAFAAVINIKDYVFVSRGLQAVLANANPFKFTTINAQSPVTSISYNPITGYFDLVANVSYKLTATVIPASVAVTGFGAGPVDINFEWTYSNGTPIYNDMTTTATSMYASSIVNYEMPATNEIIFRPTTNVSVMVKGPASLPAAITSARASITQI